MYWQKNHGEYCGGLGQMLHSSVAARGEGAFAFNRVAKGTENNDWNERKEIR